MDWSKLISLLPLLFGTGALKIVWDNWHEMNDLKLKLDRESIHEYNKAKNSFVYGIIATCFLAVVFFAILLYNPDKAQSPPTTGSETVEPEPDEPQPHLSDEIINYVENMDMADGTFSGYVNLTKLPDGYGTMEYNNLDKYTGYWENGFMHGKGKMIYANGDTYEGDWNKGLKHGQGVYTWSDGKQYDGEYKDDQRYHYGKYTGWSGVYYNGVKWDGTYEGEHVNDIFQGEGRFDFSNGDSFSGTFENGEVWNGTLTQNNRRIEIKNGKPLS